jgi:hypothetical protein
MNLPVDKWEWVGSIVTATNLTFNIIDPNPADVSMADVSCSLAHICRYNGHVPSFYSVAEHSVRVAWWLKEKGHPVNIVLTGLLHDAAEAYVGDMVRPLKRHPEFGAVHQRLEERVATAVHEALGGIFPHPQPVHDADRAIYDWEVDFIRTGVEIGWDSNYARNMFRMTYENLIDEVTA